MTKHGCRISVFGLGYVGTVSAACLAKMGHEVIGVDVNKEKVNYINRGESPIVESGLAEIVKETNASGKLSGTVASDYAILNTSISLVCVGTPSKSNGALDTSALETIAVQIGKTIAKKEEVHTVVFRSTMLPGTLENLLIPLMEKESGKKRTSGFVCLYNPEFLRESSAIDDFYNPEITVVGTIGHGENNEFSELVKCLPGELIHTDIVTAEMIKYASNSFHAVKACFANEIGKVCKSVGIDSHSVMDILCKDKRLNVSNAYLRPGFAFGGSCLPKDLRAITKMAKDNDVSVPMLESVLPSNESLIAELVKMVLATGTQSVGFAGLTFKYGTDDLRESPLVEAVERLIGKGKSVSIFDSDVALAKLTGKNKQYIERVVPHLSKLMVESLEELVKRSEVIVIGNKNPLFSALTDDFGHGRMIIDTVRIGPLKVPSELYRGVAW